jgi:hypothetical protein
VGIEAGFYARVTGDTGAAALIGDRLYPLQIPQEATLPAAAYAVVSSDPFPYLGQPASSWITRIEVSVWARSYAAARAAAAAVRAAVDHQTSGWTGATVTGVRISQGETDSYNPKTQEYETALELTVTHKE